MKGGDITCHKQGASTSPPWKLKEDPKGIIIRYLQLPQFSCSIFTPEVSCVKRGTVSSEETNFHIFCAHMKFACQHIGLCIEFTALALDIIIITKIISDDVT